MHYLLKQFLPPIVNTLRFFSFKYGWKGSYSSYEEAKSKCPGYDEKHILNRIAETTQKVVSGEAVYERDGILYDHIHPNPNLLNVLLLASAGRDRLTVIDFGGSLGTSYRQNIKNLSHLREINWCIIEQPNFVDEGRRNFESENLHFFNDIAHCLERYPAPDLLLISSVLQYLPAPYEMLRRLQSFHIPHLMIDLIGYNDKDEDRITIQHVPPVFYGKAASYPCTFFNRKKLHAQIEEDYQQEQSFISEPATYYISLKPFHYEGTYWKLRREIVSTPAEKK